ncbi:MAG: META domain-containing protein [Gammaproteobacteria bacterium]|jgi:heat shock protein HslJ|nr:META domain-containing protein [Gammaproteobacteria bacterium]MBT4146923.1 META domain-containing protein [Gammaproteobacteria bacterium]MBT5223115.1 META domain-containing protein [Gammaproteobacteria bacterium]MBT5826224.1 META domain-containing protein [Gammaproteobacteria bacterium]MBT5965804.1 META domain-containing protein [Gammaproteobacteria bacterium]
MKKKILLSLILLQGCSTTTPTNNTVAEQLIEPPNMRSISATTDKGMQGGEAMQNPLSADQWQLRSYLTEQGMQPALLDNPASIEFAEGRVGGSTGCNRYFGSYQLMGGEGVQISQPGLTMMVCPEKIAAQEYQYLKNLADINFFLLQESKLQLLDARRQVRLIFQNLPPLTLEQTAWQVTGINNGTGVINNAHTGKANLQFKDGKLQGDSGCNALTASYQINASELTIGPVSSTRKLCPEKDLMTQEQQILQALTQVTHYQIRANQLRLVNAGGSLMLSLKQP